MDTDSDVAMTIATNTMIQLYESETSASSQA